jgi:hypothetical protein
MCIEAGVLPAEQWVRGICRHEGTWKRLDNCNIEALPSQSARCILKQIYLNNSPRNLSLQGTYSCLGFYRSVPRALKNILIYKALNGSHKLHQTTHVNNTAFTCCHASDMMLSYINQRQVVPYPPKLPTSEG